jgi:hypothetical protein
MISVHWVKADIAVASVEILTRSAYDHKRVRPLKPPGGGWPNLWSLSTQDRWDWFRRKIFSFFKKKNPLVRVSSFHVPIRWIIALAHPDRGGRLRLKTHPSEINRKNEYFSSRHE